MGGSGSTRLAYEGETAVETPLYQQTVDWKIQVALPCAHHWMAQLDVQPPLPGHVSPVQTHAPAHIAHQFLCVCP